MLNEFASKSSCSLSYYRPCVILLRGLVLSFWFKASAATRELNVPDVHSVHQKYELKTAIVMSRLNNCNVDLTLRQANATTPSHVISLLM